MVERLHSGIRLVPLPHSLVTPHSQEGREACHRQPEDTAREGQQTQPQSKPTWHDGHSAADGSPDAGSALLLSGVDAIHTKQDTFHQSGNAAHADTGADDVAAVREPDAAEDAQSRRQAPDEMQPTAEARSYWHTIMLVRQP